MVRHPPSCRAVAVLGLALVLAMGAAVAQIVGGGRSVERTLHGALVEGEVRYHARDQVSAWVGVAPIAHASFELDALDLRRTRLRVVVRPGDFDSGIGFRDATARRTVFDTEQHPEAIFELEELDADAFDLPDGAVRSLVVVGTLELRGTARRIVAETVVARAGDELVVDASFDVSLEAFGLPAPRFLMLVADDHVAVEVALRARLTRATTAPTPP